MVLLGSWFEGGARRILATLFGAVLCTGLGLALYEYNLGRGLIRHSYELQLVGRGDVPVSDAAIVYMDDASHKALEQPLNAPWDRKLHARLIRRLTDAGAKAIVFDIVFSDVDPLEPAADVELERAIRDSGRVLLALDVVYLGQSDKRGVPPIEAFRTNAAGFGSAEARADTDLVVRRLLTWDDDLAIPSLSYAVAAHLQGRDPMAPPDNWGAERWLNYYGPPQFLPSVSYVDALDTNKVEAAFFQGKVVFVGARLFTKFAGDRKDEYAHPFSYWMSSTNTNEKATMNFVPGVEIQAMACLNLLRGDWLSRLSTNVERLLLAGFGLVFGVGLIRLRPVMATVAGVGGLILAVAGFQVLFNQRLIWFPILIVGIQVLAGLAWSILFNAVQFYVQQRLYEHTLALYLSPKLARKFAGNPELLKPGAEEQTISIFFSDIADFTELSRYVSSDELARVMNNYFETAVSKCIHRTDGTVVKYIGDGIFAFWNAPEGQADHAWRACSAALYFREQIAPEMNGRPLRTRIGIHTGLARVGNFGSVDRVDYTALGEDVNLASRLEGLNKMLGTESVISRETCDALGGRLVTRPVGLFQMKGFDRPIEVFELVGWPAEAEKTRAWRDVFAGALEDYREARLDAAEAGFRRTLELHPGDGPSAFYLARLAEWRRKTPAAQWLPYTILFEK